MTDNKTDISFARLVFWAASWEKVHKCLAFVTLRMHVHCPGFSQNNWNFIWKIMFYDEEKMVLDCSVQKWESDSLKSSEPEKIEGYWHPKSHLMPKFRFFHDFSLIFKFDDLKIYEISSRACGNADSHSEGPEMWFFIKGFLHFHIRASSKSSGKVVRRFLWALAFCLCDKFPFLMNWLILCISC